MKGLLIFVLLVAGCSCLRRTTMKKRSTIYLPSDYIMGNPVFKLGDNPVEQFSYDEGNKIVYVVGLKLLHAVDFSDPDNPYIIDYKQFDDIELTDVVYCNGLVYATYDDLVNRDLGSIIVLTDIPGGFTELERIALGVLPDSIVATSDCSTLVVALEGEPYVQGGVFIDPPGLVSIVNGTPGDYNVDTLDFTNFDNQVESLRASGVRYVYQESGNPFSIDVEPEFCTISDNNRFAFIALQENNAVATIDIINRVILDIKGLGFKDMSYLKMDPSNKDGGAFLNSYNVLGMYQPDGITFLRRRFTGEPLLFMANEGDSKDYDVYSEEVRGADIDPNRRLKFSVSEAGKDNNGKLDALYMFGGRGFSVRRASDMSLVYDSGDDFEQIVDYLKRDVFNSQIEDPDDRPFENIDVRSDDKSFEPNGVDVREFGSLLLIAVTCERPGAVFLYSQLFPGAPFRFQDMYFGIPDTRGKSWQELYDEGLLSEIRPEDVRIFGSEGPTNKPSMLVSAQISGTISLFDLDLWGGQDIGRALSCARYMPPFTFTSSAI